MPKAIVTGAGGFVAKALCKYLVKQGVQVTALSRNGKPDQLPSSDLLTNITFDLAKPEQISQLVAADNYDYFFHFAWAAVSGADRANPNMQLDNAKWTVECLKQAKLLGCQRFIGIGSIMEQESLIAVNTSGHKPGMGYVYGSAKLAAHMLCQSVAADIDIDFVWTELTNTYGPGENSPRLINSTLKLCLANQSPSFTAAKQNYDFVYISDVVRAYYLIAQHGKPFNSYLIASSEAQPLKEFLLQIQTLVASELEFKFGAIQFTGVSLPLSAFDTTKTKSDTGFATQVSFANGIIATAEWLSSL
ncbi:NAD-dependent dehydratase [Actinomycetota bacterium]|nr:NAD-dependent dehydratase [Actinomycetota bacterium]